MRDHDRENCWRCKAHDLWEHFWCAGPKRFMLWCWRNTAIAYTNEKMKRRRVENLLRETQERVKELERVQT